MAVKKKGDTLFAHETADVAVVSGSQKQKQVWTNRDTGQIHSSFFLKKTLVARYAGSDRLPLTGNPKVDKRLEWQRESGIDYIFFTAGNLFNTSTNNEIDVSTSGVGRVNLLFIPNRTPKNVMFLVLQTFDSSTSTTPLQTMTIPFGSHDTDFRLIRYFQIGFSRAQVSMNVARGSKDGVSKTYFGVGISNTGSTHANAAGTNEFRLSTIEIDFQNTAPDPNPINPDGTPVALFERGYVASDKAPTDPMDWDAWLNTTNNQLSIWDGNAWVSIGGGGAGTFDIQAIQAGTAAQLTSALNEQSTSNDGLIIDITNRFIQGSTEYRFGDVLFVPPNSRAIERLFNKAGVEGDTFNLLPVNSQVQLGRQITAHTLNHNAAIIQIQADFTTGVRTYEEGERYYLAPNVSNERFMTLIADRGRQYLGKIDITPSNITTKEDLDGTYQVALSDIDEDYLKSKGVNVLEVWFNAEAIHSTNWSPTDTAVIDAVIDTNEETQIALTNQKIIPVLAVFRKDGIYVAQIGTYLTIGGKEDGGASLDNIKGGTNVSIDRSKEGQITINSESGATATPQQQIALLNLVASPAGIAFKTVEELTAAVKAIDIQISNPELLTGEVWVEGWLQGQRGLNRTKWSSSTSALRIAFDDTTASAIATGVFDDTDIQCNIRFFNAASGGNEIERRDIFIPITKVGGFIGISNVKSANVTVSAANVWVDTGLKIPETDFVVNFDPAIVVGNAKWEMLRRSQITGLTVGTVGAQPGVGQSLLIQMTVFRNDTVKYLLGNIGRSSSGNLLIAMNNVSPLNLNPMPMSVGQLIVS